MENQDIKRGVDLETRFGEGASTLSVSFKWWKGEKFNKKTLLFLIAIFVLNLVIVFPVFGKDIVSAYVSSEALAFVAQLLSNLAIPKSIFFSLLTIGALSLAPVSFYLFVRRIAMRHELTAFLATLFFILPNPFFANVPILVSALMHGDGAHVVVFAFIPLFLLYVQAFMRTGNPILAVLCSFGTAIIAIISPFAAFNLVFLYTIICISEGFLGDFRLKFMRLGFLFFTGALLSFFWYYPNVIGQIVLMAHVQAAFSRFLSVAPLAIPLLPVMGVVSFLVFDRRERLKPIFISLWLFLLYLSLFAVSSNLNIRGIFTSERYLIELSFASSFFLAIVFVLVTELVLRNFLSAFKKRAALFILLSTGTMVIMFLALQGSLIVRSYVQEGIITDPYNVGIGNLQRVIDFRDIPSLIAFVISSTTFVVLLFFLHNLRSKLK